jgi:hypothetical protein
MLWMTLKVKQARQKTLSSSHCFNWTKKIFQNFKTKSRNAEKYYIRYYSISVKVTQINNVSIQFYNFLFQPLFLESVLTLMVARLKNCVVSFV